MKSFCIVFFIFLIGACTVKKATFGERTLFMEPNSNAVTLINAVSSNTNQAGRHICMMMAARNADGKQFINYYLSDWMDRDSSFRWQVHYSENLVFDATKTFPMVTIPEVKDTLDREWYWSMDRKKMKLEAKWKEEEAANYRFSYHVNDSFYVKSADKQNRIDVIDPVYGLLKANKISRHGEPVSVYISVIHDFDSLLKRFKGHTLMWLDAYLTGYGSVKTMQAIHSSGSMQTVFFLRNNEKERLWSLSKSGNDWKSVATCKLYPLLFKLQTNEAGIDFNIEPLRFDQEIRRKTSSFWMGAVAVKSGKQMIGKGNMYIFSIK